MNWKKNIHLVSSSFCFDHWKNERNFVFGCFLFFYFFATFFLFSTQNQVPQIIIALGWVIYHITDLWVAIRRTSKSFLQNFLNGNQKLQKLKKKINKKIWKNLNILKMYSTFFFRFSSHISTKISFPIGFFYYDCQNVLVLFVQSDDTTQKINNTNLKKTFFVFFKEHSRNILCYLQSNRLSSY